MKTEITEPTKVLCRICGQEFNSSLCLSVFSDAGIQQQLQHKITQMLRIQVSPQGNMPKQICHMCLNRLDAAYDLFTMCESMQDQIQRKVENEAHISEQYVHFLKEHRLTLLEEKCKSLTEYSPITIGGSVFKLRPIPTEQTTPINHIPQPMLGNQLNQIPQNQSIVNTPIQTEPSTPINHIAQPISGNQLNQMPQNQSIVNQNSWIPQQQLDPIPVQLNYTNLVQQPAQVTPVQYNQMQQPTTNQIHNNNRGENSSTMNYYEPPSTAQATVSVQSPAQTSKAVQRIPRILAKSRTVPRPIVRSPTSKPSPLSKKPNISSNTQDGSLSSKKPMRQCQYCKLNFSEDIIDHHVNLHLRKSFFTCIDCNKNFRTECALEKHRCGKTDDD